MINPSPEQRYDLIWCEIDKCHYLVPRPSRPLAEQKEHFTKLHEIAMGNVLELAMTSSVRFHSPANLPFAKLDLTKEIDRSIALTQQGWQEFLKKYK